MVPLGITGIQQHTTTSFGLYVSVWCTVPPGTQNKANLLILRGHPSTVIPD
jgi:hypothetical protein